MRTKTLVLVAAITAAGLATSLAADGNVYSLNVVGYVNSIVPANSVGGGFAILCNPLNATNNTLGALIPTAPDGTQVYAYIGGTYRIATMTPPPFEGPSSWDDPDIPLPPGAGFWIKNVAETNLPLTFVGEVLQGTQVNEIPAGFSLQGSKVPQSLVLSNPNHTPEQRGVLDLNYPAVKGSSVIYFFRGGYSTSFYDQGAFVDEEWDVPPVPAVGEGFWVYENAASLWTRTFNVQ